jgi:hypothetical protein
MLVFAFYWTLRNFHFVTVVGFSGLFGCFCPNCNELGGFSRDCIKYMVYLYGCVGVVVWVGVFLIVYHAV